MRNRLLVSGGSLAISVLIAGALAAAVVDDAYDERLDDLEERVTRLEQEVGIGAAPASEDERDGPVVDFGDDDSESSATSTDTSSTSSTTSNTSSSSSSSIASSVQRGNGTYQASYASGGDRTVPFEIEDGGTYTVTSRPDGTFSLRIETASGDAIPAFALEGAGGETLTAEGALQPGAYTLVVESDAQWTVNITLTGS